MKLKWKWKMKWKARQPSPTFIHEETISTGNHLLTKTNIISLPQMLISHYLFATLKDPKTSQGFIDRFLVACEAYHVPAIIVFNKADIYRKKELEKYEQLHRMYTSIGYKIVRMSVNTGEGVEEVKNLLAEKITLMSGHSGVGKSSFINAIFPELKLKTQDVSGWSGKGLHTTTFRRNVRSSVWRKTY